ncbi:MAG: DUF2461 domain-containing protein [Acidobacteriia bacterium]|nr:DUF2461 domain-containing protein [Terriglobia bacterium]
MFPPAALTFFRKLACNNDRDWFKPRKEIFDTTVKAPMIELVERINGELAGIAPLYVNDPKKAIYRIYRDTRFSSDKTPYKTHLAAIFPRRGAESRDAGPGLFFAVSHKGIEIAGGVYGPMPEDLLKIRTWLAENHESFLKIAAGPKKLMGELRGSSLTRIPKGFDAGHPAADLIKMKQWYYGALLDPKIATTPKLLPELMKRFKAMLPVLEELAKPLAAKKTIAMW